MNRPNRMLLSPSAEVRARTDSGPSSGSCGRREALERVDEHVLPVRRVGVGQVCHELEDKLHERAVGHAILGADMKDGRIADKLREHLAELVVAAPALAELRVERVELHRASCGERTVDNPGGELSCLHRARDALTVEQVDRISDCPAAILGVFWWFGDPGIPPNHGITNLPGQAASHYISR